MKPKKTGQPKLMQLDDERWAVEVDGYVKFAGTREECGRRMQAFYGGMNSAAYPDLAREFQDRAVGRAISCE